MSLFPPFTYGLNSERVNPTWSLTSANATYPASNASDFSDDMYAFPAMSAATTDDLVGDFGSATRVDWLILWHNFKSALTGVTVEMNSSNSWPGSLVHAVTVPNKRKNGFTQQVFVDLTGDTNYSTSGLRWIRVHMPNANDALIGLKVLAYSHKRQFNRGVKIGFTPQLNMLGIEHTTDGGQTHHYRKQAAPRVLSGQIDLNSANRQAYWDWQEDNDGVLTGIAALESDFPLNAHIVRLRSSGGRSLLRAAGDIVTTIDTTVRPGGAQDLTTAQFTAEEVTASTPEW